jgi:hypothetical protein
MPPFSGLNQDLQLLDILEALPPAETPSIDSLRARLSELCVSQSVATTPDRIDVAVSHFLSGTAPVPAHTGLGWDRPSSIAEYEKAKEIMTNAHQKLSEIVDGWSVATAGLFLLALVSAVASLCLQSLAIIWPVLFIGGSISPLVYKLFKAKFLEKQSWFINARQTFSHWVGRSSITHQGVLAMGAAPTDVVLLRRWMASASATHALRHIAKSPVPLTVGDAEKLTELAVCDEKINEQLTWEKQKVAHENEWRKSWEALSGVDE